MRTAVTRSTVHNTSQKKLLLHQQRDSSLCNLPRVYNKAEVQLKAFDQKGDVVQNDEADISSHESGDESGHNRPPNQQESEIEKKSLEHQRLLRKKSLKRRRSVKEFLRDQQIYWQESVRSKVMLVDEKQFESMRENPGIPRVNPKSIRLVEQKLQSQCSN